MSERKASAKIAVDAMGGDLGYKEVVAAVVKALPIIDPADEVILFGNEDLLIPELSRAGLVKSKQVSVCPTTEVIEMSDKPTISIRQKKDSSLVRAIEAVKNGDAHVAMSCGNTGSLMACGTLKLRQMDGVDRPALATVFPTPNHHFIFLDVGANPNAVSRNLVHNAIMGSEYAKVALGIQEPRVALLTIGTEDGKGTDLINSTHNTLRQIPNKCINYIGLIEGFHLFDNPPDVVVCDGFVGNIVLKACEGLFHCLKGFMTEQITKNPLRKMGALFSMGAFKEMKNRVNPERFGGAPLLGLNGNVVKAHGSSNSEAIKSAIKIGLEMVHLDLKEETRTHIEVANQIMDSINSNQ